MTQTLSRTSSGFLETWPKPAQWGLLAVVSAALAALFELVGIPAGFLLGPMLTAIAAGTNGSSIKVAPIPYMLGQGVVGCLIASSITRSIIVTFGQDWPLFLGIVLAVIAASSILGWLLSRWQVLPGTTAIWGASPGGATAMMLMAEAFGADARLVAFMQYARVVMVALAASIIARIWIDSSASSGSSLDLFEAVAPGALLQTLLLAGFGSVLGRFSRIPAGPMLVPLVIGAVLHVLGRIDLVLPAWLLAPAYALIGWRIGLSFNRAILVHASRAMPRILGSILVLLGFCGCLAFTLNRVLGIDPLTAYLATSPGGMDSVAIIAASSKVDLPFVMTLQAVRFVLVLIAGPTLARFAARHGARRDREAAAAD